MTEYDRETNDTFQRSIEVQYDEVQFSVRIHQNKVGDVGCVVWDAALVLGHYIQTGKARKKYIANQRILELGSGTGIVGLIAAACGAREVVVSDLPELIPLLNKNIEENTSSLENNAPVAVKAKCYCWGEISNFEEICQDMRWIDASGKHIVKCVLIADCVYYDEAVEPLAATVHHIIATGSQPVSVLCSYEDRDIGNKRQLQEKFSHLIVNVYGLCIEYIPFSEMHEEYRSPDIHIMCISKS